MMRLVLKSVAPRAAVSPAQVLTAPVGRYKGAIAFGQGGVLVALAVWGLLAPLTTQGQVRTRYRSVGRTAATDYFSLSGGVGVATYFGDLCPTGDCLTNPKPQLNLGFRGRFNERLSYRGELQFYRIGASDEDFGDASRVKRNLSFTANNFELSAQVMADLLPNSIYSDRFSRRRPVNVHVFTGIGLTTNNPTARFEGQRYNLRKLRTEGTAYGAIQPVIPIGLGVRFRTGLYTDILLEAGYRFTFTDYLDDVSNQYVPANTFTTPVAAALADRRPEYRQRTGKFVSENPMRGNPERNDSYLIVSAKLQYTFTQASLRMMRRGQMNRRVRSSYPRYK